MSLTYDLNNHVLRINNIRIFIDDNEVKKSVHRTKRKASIHLSKTIL